MSQRHELPQMMHSRISSLMQPRTRLIVGPPLAAQSAGMLLISPSPHATTGHSREGRADQAMPPPRELRRGSRIGKGSSRQEYWDE